MIGEKASKGLRPFAPQRFGRYTLLAPLASGGMGEVFLGRLEGAEGFEKLVVIKKILPQLAQEQDFVDRFVTEAKVLVKLHHGSVAQVLDMGQHEGEYYIALEFVDGKDLRKVAARCKERGHTLPLGLTLFVMMRVLDALAYAHRKKDENEKDLNLVHRDVSPQNVLISYEGEVKVIDFGLAKSSLSLGRTNPSVILGKFFYMSPEQAKHGKVDRRSDLYAAGICLYELIAGKNPFEGVSQGELMAAVANPRLEPLGLAMPGVPENVEALVMKALAPDPKDRFNSAEEMRGRVMAAMLELDPGAGPESLAHFMRAVFANEYGQERRVFAGLRESSAASRTADARTGLMPALRLADEPAAPPTLGTPRVPLTPATAETHAGQRGHLPHALNATAPFELPLGRDAEATRPAEVGELASLEPDPTLDAPTLVPAEFSIPDEPPRAAVTTDPGRPALTIEPELPDGRPSEDDPQEFQLPFEERKETPSLPVIEAAMILDEPPPMQPPPAELSETLPPQLTVSQLSNTPGPMPAVNARPPSPKPASAAAAPRPAPAGAGRPSEGSVLPKIVVSDDLVAPDLQPGQRIETLSTRPLMGAVPPAGKPRARTGDKPSTAPAARRPDAPAPRAPPVIIEAGAKPAAPPPASSSARTSILIGLGIGAGLVLLAVVALLAWNLLR